MPVRIIRQQTAVINSIRAQLAEFGIVAPVGRKGVTELLSVVADPNDKRVPEVARACLAALGTQLLALKEQILEFDRMIWPGIDPTRRASAFITFLGSARCSRLRWLRVLPIPEPSGPDVTSPPGLGSFPNSTQVGASNYSAALANRGTAICGAFSWPRASVINNPPRLRGNEIAPDNRRDVKVGRANST